MLAITAGTIGWDFAVGKTIAAFAIGMVGGAVTLTLSMSSVFVNPVKASAQLVQLRGQCEGGAPAGVNWRIWREPARRSVFRASAYSTAWLMLMRLSAAFAVEYFLHLWLPTDLLPQYVGDQSTWAVPIAAFVGAPIYLEGYAALPLLRGLIDNGMGDGVAMTFLIAGGIISAWAAVPVYALVRFPVFVTYLLLAVTGAMLAGWAFAAAVG